MEKTLKTFAASYGLQTTHNAAYGSLRGYTAAVTKKQDYLQFIFSASFPDKSTQRAFEAALYQKSIAREYRVLDFIIRPQTIEIAISYHAAKEIGRVEAFINYFIPFLAQFNASRSDFCSECGNVITDGMFRLVDGIAYHLHPECNAVFTQRLLAEKQSKKTHVAGNLITGLVRMLPQKRNAGC